MTKAESMNTLKDLIPKSMAALRQKMHASYSAMLFAQLKQSLAVKGVWHPSGDMSITPITPIPGSIGILVQVRHMVWILHSCLPKISKFRNFNFSKWNLEFFIYRWISFIFLHALMNCDLWHLILTKKSKFDFSVYSWLLISWL